MAKKPNIIEAPDMGVSDGPAFIAQPRTACPPDGMRNIVPVQRGGAGRDVRFRLKTRPPLLERFGVTPTGEHPVQAAGRVGQASAFTGFNVGNVTTVGPTGVVTRESGYVRSNAMVLDPDWSIRALFTDNRGGAFTDPPTGPGGQDAYNACWNPDNDDIGFFVTHAIDNGVTTDDTLIVGLNRIDLTTDTITHQTWVVDAAPGYSTPLNAGTIHIAQNRIACKPPYVFVVAAYYLYVFRADNLTYLKRYAIPFAIEGQDIDLFTANGIDYISVAFTGSAAIVAPVVSDAGPTPREAFGEHFRSGLALYKLNYASAALKTPVAVNGDALTRIAMPQGTQSPGASYENHRTFRLAEYDQGRPRGRLIYTHRMGSDGYVYLGHCNQGFGYDGSQTDQRPDGQSPFVTVSKVNLNAALATAPAAFKDPATASDYGIENAGGWQADTDSYRRAFLWGGNTYYNDIPQIVNGARIPGAVSDAPSVFAMAYNAAADVLCVGGRRPAPLEARANVYALRGADGARVWSRDLKGLIQQNAISVNPSNGHFIVGFGRNNGYPGAESEFAEMAELDKDTGAIIRTKDMVIYNGWLTSLNGRWSAVYGLAVNRRGQVLVPLAPYRYQVP